MEKVKELYVFSEKLYDLFIYLLEETPESENVKKLEILDKFFITYKYPSLDEFAQNIERHTGEDGPTLALRFLRFSYEMFLKETDPKIYSVLQVAEDVFCGQNGIKYILELNKE